MTMFCVPLDDETMEAVMEQAEAAQVAPRDLIAAVVRDTFLMMKAEGVTFARREPDEPPTDSRH